MIKLVIIAETSVSAEQQVCQPPLLLLKQNYSSGQNKGG